MAKSWDIQPNRKPAQPAPQPRPAPQAAPVHKAAAAPRQQPTPVRRQPQPTRPQIRDYAPRSAPKAPVRTRVRAQPAEEAPRQHIVRKQKVVQGRDRQPLKDQRRRARIRRRYIYTALVLILIAGAIAALWTPAFRIQNVNATGPDAQGVERLTQGVLAGAKWYVLPNDSIFLFSQSAIRTNVLAQYPDIAALSISRSSLSSISIASSPREAAITWCGESYAAAANAPIDTTSSSTASSDTSAIPAPSCYNADLQGVIFAQIQTPPADSLIVYGPLSQTSSTPLGAHIQNAKYIPNVIQFVKAMRSLNVPIKAVMLRTDEADLYAASGTRITYVLGREKAAAQLAESAFPSLNLNDGSLEYVDLRFEGKLYFKKKGGGADTTSSTATQ